MTADASLTQLVCDEYPFPISHAYGYLESRAGSEDRYQALLACFEVTLKMVGAIALSNFVSDVQITPDFGDSHLYRALLETLSRPLSLGHWHAILWRTLRPYATRRDRLAVPELFDFYYRVTEHGNIRSQKQNVQIIQRFILGRNEEAHHRSRSQTGIRQRQVVLAELEASFATLLEGLSFLANYRVLFVEHAKHHQGQWYYRANHACGSTYPFRQDIWRTPLSVNAQRCLLVANVDGRVLELDPFVIVTAEGKLQQPDLFFFDGIFSSGRANFMNYHVGDYIDPTDDESPASVASDAISSLLRLLENQLPPGVDEEAEPADEKLSGVEIYRAAVAWAVDHGERQTITLDMLRQILGLQREEALKQERELETARGVEVEPEEVEVPFEGEPTWGNLAYYVLASSGQVEMFYKDIAKEAEELKHQYDDEWAIGDSSHVAGSVSAIMSNDPRFYKLHRGYYRLTKNNELLSNPSWANLAYFVLKHSDQKRRGMHLSDISTKAMELKEKHSDWRSENARTPSHTVSATMSMDHRFESMPERGYWRLAAETDESTVSNIGKKTAEIKSQATTRSDTYSAVLARISQIGEIVPLSFGHTYYALGKQVHLMFRYSKAHYRNSEIEYFLGVTPQYFSRIDALGKGFMVFVLGTAERVLIVPTSVFSAWVAGVDPSGSGTWPIAFYMAENSDSQVARWVPGAGREDVSVFLDDYASLTRALAMPNSVRPARKQRPIRVADLLEAGLLKVGDVVCVKKEPGVCATVLDGRVVLSDGERKSYIEWGRQVTGWSAINIYPQMILKRTGETLDELRRKLQALRESTAV